MGNVLVCRTRWCCRAQTVFVTKFWNRDHISVYPAVAWLHTRCILLICLYSYDRQICLGLCVHGGVQKWIPVTEWLVKDLCRSFTFQPFHFLPTFPNLVSLISNRTERICSSWCCCCSQTYSAFCTWFSCFTADKSLFCCSQMDDIDAMFSHLLGEMDDLSQVSSDAPLWAKPHPTRSLLAYWQISCTHKVDGNCAVLVHFFSH